MSDAIDTLIQSAASLKAGPEKAAILEEAIRLADAAQDIERAFRLRVKLIEAGSFGGIKDRAIVAFGWCLAQSDRDPKRFPEGQLLWSYKWIVCDFKLNPSFSMKQIRSMFDDLERRYVRNGYSARAAHHKRWTNFMEMGLKEQAAKYYALWESMPRDTMSDCQWCELHNVVSYKEYIGDDNGAIATALPMLDGKKRCLEIPHLTYTAVLKPLMRLNRLEEAENYQRVGYRMISENREFLTQVGIQLILCGRLGKVTEGLAMLEKHSQWAMDSFNLQARFMFYSGAAAFLEALSEQGTKEIAIFFPTGFEGASKNGRYKSKKLAAWFDKQAKGLAKKFDKRNGTPFLFRYSHRASAVGDRLYDCVSPLTLRSFFQIRTCIVIPFH